jgi:hypothetical protein
MQWAENVARIGRGTYQIVGKPEEKRPLGRRWHKCDIDINMDIQAVGWGGMDWMCLNQDRNG